MPSGMTPGGAVPDPRDLQRLRHRAAMADDAALLRICAMLDRTEDRGEADRVLDMARPRLSALRPPRPISFLRLLFLPLDGVIVPAARWRRGASELPRSALPALGAAVRAALGETAAEALLREAEGRDMGDAAAVAGLGGWLWPRAARALPDAAPPAWEAATALPAADYGPLAGLCRAVWAEGVAIHAALRAAAEGPPAELVRAALAPLAEAGAGPLRAGLATLLSRAARPGQVIATAAALGPKARAAVLPALEAELERPPLPSLSALAPRQAAEAVAAAARRLEDLAGCGLLGATQRRRLHALRRAAEEACRARLQEGGEAQVMAPLGALLGQGGAAPDAAIAAIEAAARGLRVLALEARRLDAGSAAPPERVLQALTPRLRALASRAAAEGGPGVMDLARIVEILDGPDAAAALLPPRWAVTAEVPP